MVQMVIEAEGRDGHFEVVRYPNGDKYWQKAYRIYYTPSPTHKGYRRYKTVLVGKNSSAQNTAVSIRYEFLEFYRRLFGYVAYRNLVWPNRR